jgi:hypothetical protein
MEHYLAMTEHTTSDTLPGTFTGRDVLYREKGVSALDVQRAADALLRRGQKPSIATVREQLGGGSPNTLAPLLEQYWKALGSRVAAGPEALERVPESLARMTEALWLRSIDEARQRAKASLAGTTPLERGQRVLEDKVTELTAALAASRARASELESQLLASAQDALELRTHVRELTALLRAEQELRVHPGRPTDAEALVLNGRLVTPRRRIGAQLPEALAAPARPKRRSMAKTASTGKNRSKVAASHAGGGRKRLRSGRRMGAGR